MPESVRLRLLLCALGGLLTYGLTVFADGWQQLRTAELIERMQEPFEVESD